MGPPVKVYDTIDYALWLLSKQSGWLPNKWRNYLLQGMKGWAVWPWSTIDNDSNFESNSFTGALQHALYSAKFLKAFRLTQRVKKDMSDRFEHTINTLGLPETVDKW